MINIIYQAMYNLHIKITMAYLLKVPPYDAAR